MKEYKYKINGNKYTVEIGDVDNGTAQVVVNGVPYQVELEDKTASVKTVAAPKPSAAPRTSTGEKVIAAARPAAGGAGAPVKSPLPGTVMSISVKVGDAVKAADTVVVLEAMKMENSIHAGVDGVVKSVDVNAGDAVLEGTVLLTIG